MSTSAIPTHHEAMERIQLHVGRINQNAARIDMDLTAILALLIAGPNLAIAQAIFKNEQASAKLSFLERALAVVDWPGGKRLLSAIKRINERRNRMSHSSAYSHIDNIAKIQEHYTVREKRNYENEPIALGELEHWETCAEVVSLVTLALARQHEPLDRKPEPREIALGFFTDDPNGRIRKAIDDILPAVR